MRDFVPEFCQQHKLLYVRLFFLFSRFFEILFFCFCFFQAPLSSLLEHQALQQRALSLMTDTQSSFVENLILIYELDSMDPAILRSNIMKLQALHCYKEVSLSFDVNIIKHARTISDEHIRYCTDLYFMFFTGSSAQH